MNDFKIPYGKQNITDEDIQAVSDVLRDDFLTQGPRIAQFETDFGQYINNELSVAVSNGTAALHLAILSFGLKPGDKVITTPITFAASANCVEYAGGEVIFADIDPKTYLIDLNSVESLLQQDPSIVGVIPVDFAGRVVDTEQLKAIVDKHNCWILEDACHAPGGYFIDSEGEKVLAGSCKYSDAVAFSFHPVKHIACGEGGMVSFKQKEAYEKAMVLRTHGIFRDTGKYQNSAEFAAGQASEEYPGWYMEMQTLGFNYRLTDIQAALGISQLKRADEGLIRRREIAAKYANAFQSNERIIGQSGVVEGHAYHLYIVEVNNRVGLYNYLRERNIFAQIHYIPVHKMPYYQSKWDKELAHAEKYYKHCISLPMYPTLTEEEQQYVIDSVIGFVNG